jgi:hypothetical protein
VILPRLASSSDLPIWYVLCRSAETYRSTRDELQALVGSSFAPFSGAAANFHDGDAIDGAVREAYGAYAFKIPVLETGLVTPLRERLLLYLQLLAERPPRIGVRTRSAGRILREFEYALVTRDEQVATECVEELRSAGYLDASNLLFLDVRLLDTFGHWSALVALPELQPLLSIKRPRRVTEALVRAVYAVHLSSFEATGDAGAALERFKSVVASRYAALYETRAGLRGPEIDVSFALKAATAVPPQRDAITAILSGYQGESLVGAYLSAILALTPSPVGEPDFADAHSAFQAGEVDRAFDLAIRATPSFDTCVVLIRCAREMETLTAARTAVTVFHGLSVHDQARITDHSILGRQLRHLQDVMSDEAPDAEAPSIASWSEWLSRLESDRPWPHALDVAERGVAEWDASFETKGTSEITTTAGLLLAERPLWARQAFFDSLPYLLDAFLPHTADVRLRPIIESLLIAIAVDEHVSVPRALALLRVADALLAFGVTPSHYRDLVGQIADAIDSLESVAAVDLALDALELLLAAACPDPSERILFFERARAIFSRWYRRTDRAQWLLLQRLGDELGVGASVSVPTLPATEASEASVWDALNGKTVAFYSLRESALRRTEELMAAMAPSVRVIVFSDHVGGSPALRTAATTAFLFVLATEAATHAAVGFIRAQRSEELPIAYARGQGSTGLLTAVRNHLQQLAAARRA